MQANKPLSLNAQGDSSIFMHNDETWKFMVVWPNSGAWVNADVKVLVAFSPSDIHSVGSGWVEFSNAQRAWAMQEHLST